MMQNTEQITLPAVMLDHKIGTQECNARSNCRSYPSPLMLPSAELGGNCPTPSPPFSQSLCKGRAKQLHRSCLVSLLRDRQDS